MSQPTLLKQLVGERHWAYWDFRKRYRSAATKIGYNLDVSERQYGRWLAGKLKSLPHPSACQALEEMFGLPVETLLSWAPGDATPAAALPIPNPPSSLPVTPLREAEQALPDSIDLPWTHRGIIAVLDETVSNTLANTNRRTFVLVTGAAASAPAAAWLRKDPDLATAGFGQRRVSAQTVAALEKRLDQLRRLDDEVGVVGLLPCVVGDLAFVVSVLKDANYAESTGRGLHDCAAELARLAGWAHYEAGRDDLAQHFFEVALRASHTANNWLTGGHILAVMALQAYNVGDPRDAIALIETAQAGCRDAPPVVRALFASRLARAHAESGNQSLALTALNEVAELIALGPTEDDPAWAYYVTPAGMRGQAASCYLALGDYDRAEIAYTEALLDYGDGFPRDQAVALSRLARAYLGRHELDQACATAQRAVRLLAENVDSPRSNEIVRDFSNRLRPHSGSRLVRDFFEETRELLATN